MRTIQNLMNEPFRPPETRRASNQSPDPTTPVKGQHRTELGRRSLTGARFKYRFYASRAFQLRLTVCGKQVLTLARQSSCHRRLFWPRFSGSTVLLVRNVGSEHSAPSWKLWTRQ